MGIPYLFHYKFSCLTFYYVCFFFVCYFTIHFVIYPYFFQYTPSTLHAAHIHTYHFTTVRATLTSLRATHL